MKTQNDQNLAGNTFLSRLTRYKWHLLLIFYYSFISLLFIKCYRHQIDADGISYISLAQKYFAGDFFNAINGYWSPLISWLLAPLLCLQIEPMLAFRIASLIIGGMTLVGIDKLLSELHVTKSIRALYLISLSPVIAWYAENDVGADLLCACLLLYYLKALLRDKYVSYNRAGFLVGLMAALAYLAKNYNFYFFLLHFTCVNLCYWVNALDKQQKRNILLNFTSAAAVFTLVSGVWIGLISYKYHHVTVSTAGDFNLSLVRPNSTGYPMLSDGFLAPPNNTAVSAWEDPTFIKITPWSPFRTVTDLLFFTKHVKDNVSKYLRGILVNYIFILTIIYFVIISVFSRKKINKKLAYIALTILMYPLGYFALYYDGQRHVLINIILLYILSAVMLHKMLDKYNNNNIIRYAAFAILFASLLSLTLIRFNRDYRTGITTLNDIYHMSNEIRKYYNLETKYIASQDGDWNHTLDLSFFLKARFFGRAKTNISNEELRKELIDNKIDYFLDYGGLKNGIDILQLERRFEASTGNFTLYKVVLNEGKSP